MSSSSSRALARKYLRSADAYRTPHALACALFLTACSHEKPPSLPESGDGTRSRATATPAEDASVSGSDSAWETRTFSPRPGSVPEPELEPLVDACGAGDSALHEVATWMARVQAERGEPPTLDEVNFELRKRGSPFVMPRIWSALAMGEQSAELATSVKTWVKAKRARGELRCGGGVAELASGERVFSLLQVDVVAELEPLATRAPEDGWMNLRVRFTQPTTAASVVLLPPDGAPKSVATKLTGDRAEARFALDVDGVWQIQVMATQEGGPLPVLAATVTKGDEPPAAFDAAPVPGEEAYDASLAPDEALFRLVNATRKEKGLPELARNRALDRAAQLHSRRMKEVGRIGHDTGHGDPAHRVAEVGVTPKATGENVALAASVPRLHRALWNSPSHRENLLLRRWDEIGVGIVTRDDGLLLATELFIDSK